MNQNDMLQVLSGLEKDSRFTVSRPGGGVVEIKKRGAPDTLRFNVEASAATLDQALVELVGMGADIGGAHLKGPAPVPGVLFQEAGQTFSEGEATVGPAKPDLPPTPPPRGWDPFAGITWESAWVDPEMANKLLATIKPDDEDTGERGQRELSEAHVAKIMMLMGATGEDGLPVFKLSADPVIIDQDGHLRNAMHRLTAVVAANVTVPMWITRGWPGEVFAITDKGKARTLADTLHVLGATNARALSGQLHLMWRIKNLATVKAWRGGRSRGLEHEMLELAHGLDDVQTNLLLEAVRWASKNDPPKFLRRPALAAARYYVATACGDWDITRPWFDRFRDGTDPDLLSPGYITRKYLENLGQGKPLTGERLDRVGLTISLIVRAWNADMEGRSIGTRITFDSETLTIPAPVPLRRGT